MTCSSTSPDGASPGPARRRGAHRPHGRLTRPTSSPVRAEATSSGRDRRAGGWVVERGHNDSNHREQRDSRRANRTFRRHRHRRLRGSNLLPRQRACGSGAALHRHPLWCCVGVAPSALSAGPSHRHGRGRGLSGLLWAMTSPILRVVAGRLCLHVPHTRGGVRPTEIEAAAGPLAAPLAMRTASSAHHWWRRNPDTVHDDGCVIPPQAEVEDEGELPLAFPARGSFEIADLTSAATGFDSEPVNTSGQGNRVSTRPSDYAHAPASAPRLVICSSLLCTVPFSWRIRHHPQSR